MALGEQRRAEGARRDAVREVRAHAAGAGDVVRRRRQVVGAGRDVGVDVPVLVRPPVALHVDAPGVVAQTGEVVHRRGVGPARNLEVEGRLGAHRGPVDEQDRPSRLGRSRRRPSPRGTGAPAPSWSSARARAPRLGGHHATPFSPRVRRPRGQASKTVQARGSKPIRSAWPTWSDELGSAWIADARPVVQHHVAVDEVAEKREVGDLASQDPHRRVPGARAVRRQPEALGPNRHLHGRARRERAAQRDRNGLAARHRDQALAGVRADDPPGQEVHQAHEVRHLAAGGPRVDLAGRAVLEERRRPGEPRSGRRAPSPPPDRG